MGVKETSIQKSFPNYCPNELEKIQVIRIYTRILINLESVVICCTECEECILRVEDLLTKHTVPITCDSSIIPADLTHKVHRERIPQIIVTDCSKLQRVIIPSSSWVSMTINLPPFNTQPTRLFSFFKCTLTNPSDLKFWQIMQIVEKHSFCPWQSPSFRIQREWTSFQASVLFPDYAAENLFSLSAKNGSQALNILTHLTI